MASLIVKRLGRVAVLTLNRPEHGNRLTTALAGEVAAALRAARDDAEVGACVLTGGGDMFCLGGDYRGAGPTDEGRAAYADALPKKVLFDLIYRARLTNTEEALSLHLINEALPGAQVLPRAIALAEQASSYDPKMVALGRGLFYETRAARPSEVLAQARRALLAALADATAAS